MDTVKIHRSTRRKTISIEIKPDASISVTAPIFFPSLLIKKFLKEKQEWIEKKQLEIKLRNESAGKNEKELWFLGKKYPLVVRQNRKSIVEFDKTFYITSTNTRSRKVYLTSWYKQQARKIIQERLNFYSNLSGLRYQTMSITDAETRWGSCSSDKNLHFNWRLIMAPIEVIDYVIAHELAHLVEMNHTRDFWEKVRKMFPVYRQYRTWLKRNGHMLRI